MRDFVDPHVVRVGFPGSPKSYNYMTDIPEVGQGDLVVIESRGDFKLVTVGAPVRQTPENLQRATAWIVDKVDLDAHNLRQAEDLI